jgi:hypothetical protein
MPARKKPADARVDNRPQRAALVALPSRAGGGGSVAPTPSRSWLKTTKDAWAEFFASDRAAVLDAVTLPAFRRLFEMRDMQRRAWARYVKQPYVDGSQGQLVANPAFDEAMKLERAIVALEDRYGISLKALANLGVSVGQAVITAAELNRMADARDKDSDDDADWIDA